MYVCAHVHLIGCVCGWVFVLMFNLHLCTCAIVMVGVVVMYETIVNVLLILY